MSIFLTGIVYKSCYRWEYHNNSPRDNTKPIASFTVTPSTGKVSTMFSFDASDSTDNESDAKSLEVRWDWIMMAHGILIRSQQDENTSISQTGILYCAARSKGSPGAH